MLQEQQAKTVESAEKGRVVQPSLLKALYRAYGFPYLLLGIIKLINDILGFAGPLLLNVLIRYLETPPRGTDMALQPGSSSPDSPEWRWHWLPKPDSLGFGLLCAALLGVTSLVKVGTFTPLGVLPGTEAPATKRSNLHFSFDSFWVFHACSLSA